MGTSEPTRSGPMVPGLVVSWLLGLLGFAGSLFSMSTQADGVTISFDWALSLALLAAMAHGWRGGLVAALGGLAALYPFLLWPDNGYANFSSVLLMVLWFGAHGWAAEQHARQPRWYTHPLAVQLPHSALYAVVVYATTPYLLALNPAPWCGAECTLTMSSSIRSSIAAKSFVMLFFNVAVASALTMTPQVRDLLGLPPRPHGERNGRILLASLGLSVALGLVTIQLASIYGMRESTLPIFGRALSGVEALYVFVLIGGGLVVAQSVMLLSERLAARGDELARRFGELRSSEDSFRSVIESLGECLFLIDPASGEPVLLNHQAAATFGDDPTDATRRAFSGLAEGPTHGVRPPRMALRRAGASSGERARADNGEMLAPLLLRTAQDGRAQRGWTARNRHDESIEVLGAIRPIRLGTGQEVLICSLRDVSEQRRVEQELEQSRKLDAMGRLAGGVAHDFNNMLAAIFGASEALADSPRLDADDREHLDTIGKAADRARDLTRQLLDLARKRDEVREPVDVHATVRETASMLEHTVLDTCITTDLRATDAWVLGNAAQLQSALLNLGVNGAQAAPGGTIRISTYDEVPPDGPPRLVLTVTDDGRGIAVEHLPHVFDPFFTTKPVGSGTGLGLAAVHGAVRDLGGTITVESALGEGTTFTVRLPTHASPSSSERASPASVVEGRGRLLLVDDEPLVRRAMTMSLKRQGYTVVAAKDGPTALELLAELGDDVEAVILDAIMPNMSGAECFRKMIATRPDLCIVMCSGYTAEQDVETLIGEGLGGFIRKPATGLELRGAIEEARHRLRRRHRDSA